MTYNNKNRIIQTAEAMKPNEVINQKEFARRSAVHVQCLRRWWSWLGLNNVIEIERVGREVLYKKRWKGYE
jgi:hypothetical protein